MRRYWIHRLGTCVVVLIAGVVCSSGCATFYLGDDAWTGQDKLYHFVAGGVIGAGTTHVLERNGMKKHHAPVYGITASVGVGGGKEWYDANVKGTYWSWKDMVWDMIGGATGSYLVSGHE